MACYDEDMGNLQIKNVPDDMHAELRRRAAQADLSLRDYVLRLLRRHLSLPSAIDWVAELRTLTPVTSGKSSADLVKQARRERDREIDRRLRE